MSVEDTIPQAQQDSEKKKKKKRDGGIWDRGQDGQDAQAKNQHESKLLPARQLQRRQHGHGHDHDPDIGDDLQGRIKIPDGLARQTTVEARIGVPEVGHGDAEQERAEGHPETDDGDDDEADDGHDAVAGGREETQVQHEHGELGQDQSQAVEGDGQVEGLELVDDLGPGKLALGLSQAIVCFWTKCVSQSVSQSVRSAARA